MKMFRERYTEQARKALIDAEDWEVKLNSPFISPEQSLLGLLDSEESLAFQILERLGVNTRKLKSELEIKLREQAPSESPTSSPTFTPSAKQVLIRAADEARSMRDTHINTAHLLLGLLWGEESFASEILTEHGVRYEDVMKFFSRNEGRGRGNARKIEEKA
ncbi:MAG: hypothetical protein N2116_02600 [Armatimonadetes bacterium]|nr:hypothetical protein [Armatimonadota bacterium]